MHLQELQAKARDVNARLLHHEHVGQGCVLASPAFERIARPTTTVDGRRAPALRFGDPWVVALAGALAVTANLVGGFTNVRLPHSNTYALTEDGRRFAIFYTKVPSDLRVCEAPYRDRPMTYGHETVRDTNGCSPRARSASACRCPGA